MITYGFSVQGKSHIKRGTVCQDYSKVVELGGGWYLGVVADGVGSAPRADVGSRMATEALCNYCRQNIDPKMSDGQLENMVRRGYEHAWGEIVRHAQKENAVIDHFDTTLSAALYNGEKVIYGHAGDGGILVRQYDGQIRPITKRQKGADGTSVIPLRGGELSWEFGIYEEKAAAVLLATDGMLDGVFQPVLVNLPPDRDSLVRGNFSNNNAYVTASEFFMSPDSVYRNRRIKDPDTCMKKFIGGELEEEDQEVFLKCILESYIKLLGKENAIQIGTKISKYYYAVWALKEVTDDKSVVCIMNERKRVTPQDITYYDEPDWKHRKECYNALLYGKPMPEKPREDMSGGSYLERKREQKIEDDFEKASIKKSDRKPNIGVRIRTNRIRIVAFTSVIAVLLLGGVIVGMKLLSGGKDSENVVGEVKVPPFGRKQESSSKKVEVETEKVEETNKDELTDAQRSKMRKIVQSFTKVLGDIRDLETFYGSNKIYKLKNELEGHGLSEKLKKFLENHTTDKNSRGGIPSPNPSSTPSPTQGQGENGNTENLGDLAEDISMVDSKKKIKFFMEKFEDCYEKMDEGKQENLRENLKELLNFDD